LTTQRESSNNVNLYNTINRFPLPWSHYVCLLSVKNADARAFYEKEALRGGWSARELKRQIKTMSYERLTRSRSKDLLLTKGAKRLPEDTFIVEEELKDPYILEFLDLGKGYSERDLEEALISKLQDFLLELGSEFSFVGRQKGLRIGGKWYKIDLLFFHRVLKCLIIIDLKIGEMSHADIGQMNMYINYATEHLMYPGENPPIGLILCRRKDKELAHYALGNIRNIAVVEHKINLNREALISEMEQAQKLYA
jgi:predicted nuclease of restriction endonuclease-like (RecB) superfamily